MLKEILPRLVLSLLLMCGAYFAFFESVYLQDQAAEFGELKITIWMWAFRAFTTVLFVGGAFFAFALFRRMT